MPLTRAVPVLTVRDLREAVESYRGLLGVDVLMDHGWIVTVGSAETGAQFSLIEADDTAPVNPSASLQVPDVDRAYAGVVSAGLEILHDTVDESWGGPPILLPRRVGNVVNVLAHVG